MLREFVDKIASMARQSVMPEAFTHDGIPDRVGVVVDGQLEWHDTPPPKRASDFLSVDSFVAAMIDANIAPEPEVFIGPNCVYGVLSRSTRRETVRLEITQTRQWQRLRGLAGMRAGFSAAEAYRLLAVEFRGCVPESIIEAVRELKFIETVEIEGARERDSSKRSKKAKKAAVGAEGVPETFIMSVPVSSTDGLDSLTQQIEVGMFLNVDNHYLEIEPLMDEIQRAEADFGREVEGLLTAAFAVKEREVPVFRGMP